ncbi:MAG: glycosyltransferase [Chitinophagaceae bacterium]
MRAKRLQISLPRLLSQQYSGNWEIIVVNDRSTDETPDVLASLAASHPHLKIISVGEAETRTFPGKKYPLSRGAALAQYENLLLCDADCYPASDQWASVMSAPLNQGKELVAGYGAYEYHPGLLNSFIRWETLHTFLLYSTFGKSGLPYMAVGRNLACKKELLLRAQKDPLWSLLPSGDDDLLIRLTANRKNYTCIADPRAFTYSDAPDSLTSWIAQKQRHVSTGKLYRKTVQFLLSLYAGSHGLMWICFIVLYCAGLGYLVASMMLLRCVFAWSLWSTAASNLHERRINLKLPLLDFLWLVYHMLLSPYIFFKNKRQWT